MSASSPPRKRVDLINDPIGKSLRLFAIPLAFSFVVNMVYSLIDRFYVSRLGDAAIAAIGSSDQVVFFLFTLVSGFAVGTGIIVSRRFGEGDHTGASRTATQALVGMAVMAATVSGLVYLLLPTVPLLMRMSPEVAELSLQYLGMLLLGFTCNLLNFQMFSIVRSTGNSIFPMKVLVTTVILNAVIAPFLIFGIGPFPELGMKGAGLATALSQMCGTAIALTALLRGKTNMKLDFTEFKLDYDLLSRVAKQGFPASLQMLSVSVNRAVIFTFVSSFGVQVTAAYTLGLNVDMFVFMSVFAVGISVETATGQNLGAGKPDRVWGFHRSAVKQMSALMVSLAIIVWFFGRPFIELYSSNPATIDEATRYLHITVFGYVFFAIGLITVRVMSGAGSAVISMLVTSGCLLGLQLPLSYFLSHATGLGSTGIWVGITAGYMVFAAVAWLVLRSKIWMKARV
ncbi:MAG: MATE family efflux transporter [Candidatus Kapabacteria bacterium]|nr:MATE family efflux transporter [Candidatus Kapabacteria bacterium]